MKKVWTVEEYRAFRNGGVTPEKTKIKTEAEGRLKTRKGWVEVGGKRIYCMSRWEMNWALYCEFRKGSGVIKDWEYEPVTFWFEAIKRGVRSYKPDFQITLHNDHVFYEEVKGYMDKKSKTKIKRMAKYHPDIELNIIDKARYEAVEKNLGRVITNWYW